MHLFKWTVFEAQFGLGVHIWKLSDTSINIFQKIYFLDEITEIPGTLPTVIHTGMVVDLSETV